MSNIKSFFSVIGEFLKALIKSYTYSIWENGYVIFGILWGMPVPIVTIGISLYCNQIALSLSAIVGEILAHPFQIIFLLHPIIFGIVFGAMGTVREEKEKQKLEFEESLIIKNKELADVNKKLQELDQLKDNFLSMVSHELKTPLTTVQGYITFVKDGLSGALSERQREVLWIAEEQIDHLDNLIGELVDLSKIKAGRFEVNPEPVDLTQIAVKTINSLKYLFDGKGISLENKLPEKLSLVLADRKRMSQVFINLLGNALKFTQSGGKVTVSAHEKDTKIQFCVSDTGIGIPEDEIDGIFNKFYQVDSTAKRKYGGCGLGLAITKHIIELHKGGDIWVESEVGKGSKFFFELKKYEKLEKVES